LRDFIYILEADFLCGFGPIDRPSASAHALAGVFELLWHIQEMESFEVFPNNIYIWWIRWYWKGDIKRPIGNATNLVYRFHHIM